MSTDMIGVLLRTQDNRATAVPIFAVQQRVRTHGFDSEYADAYEWLDTSNDCDVPEPEEAARLDAEGGGVHDGWVKAYYHDRWEFVFGEYNYCLVAMETDRDSGFTVRERGVTTLKCADGKVGELEPWMPAFLTATDWARFGDTGEPIDQEAKLGRIAGAIASILKEAEG